MSRFIVGTAGHIDHGKSTLIKALTGISTDRLIEEQKRGISIVNGYAWIPYKDDRISIIDVPGHEKFIKNMLSGITAIDLVLFVVAADEGVMQQTREHFDILRLLEVEKGMFLITKSDMVDEDMLELVELDISDLIQGTPYEDWPILPVSAYSGLNLEPVRQFIFDHYDHYSTKPGYAPRLHIDRLFQSRGVGEILTGSLEENDLLLEQTLTQYPGGGAFRIRSMEVHDQSTSLAPKNSRVALNVTSDRSVELTRGAVLSLKDAYFCHRNALVNYLILEEHRKLAKNNAEYKFYFGSREIKGKMIFFDETRAEILLDEDLLLYPNQIGIIRSLSPVRTIGRVRILDANPPQGKRAKARYFERMTEVEESSLRRFLHKYKQGALRADLQREVAREIEAEELSDFVNIAEYYFHPEVIEQWRKSIFDKLQEYFKANPYQSACEKEILKAALGDIPRDFFDRLLNYFSEMGEIELLQQKLRPTGYEARFSEEDRKERDRILQEFEDYGLEPPAKDEILKNYSREKRGIFRHLVESGDIISVSNELFLRKTVVIHVKNDIIKYLNNHDSLELAQIRDWYGISRKFIVPLLEYFDRIKVTQRTEQGRILTKEYYDG